MKETSLSAARPEIRGWVALLLSCFLTGLSATAALAADTASLSLRTTEDLYRVCTVPPTDPMSNPPIFAKDS